MTETFVICVSLWLASFVVLLGLLQVAAAIHKTPSRKALREFLAASQPFCAPEADIGVSWQEEEEGHAVEISSSDTAGDWNRADRYEVYVTREQMDRLIKAREEVQ